MAWGKMKPKLKNMTTTRTQWPILLAPEIVVAGLASLDWLFRAIVVSFIVVSFLSILDEEIVEVRDTVFGVSLNERFYPFLHSCTIHQTRPNTAADSIIIPMICPEPIVFTSLPDPEVTSR